MGGVSPDTVGRPLVKVLFAASLLLSIVSYYTTQQGMAMYLAPWFAVLAALGVQTTLVMVAWLIGFTRRGRALLVAVYAITAVVSMAFSYVALHTWFTARERPALVQRKLFDELTRAVGQGDELLSASIAEGEKHALALEEMTDAEKSHGFISRAADSDPWLHQVREAVAREAATYSESYREGAGVGLRYTAFSRHARLARQSLAQLEAGRAALRAFRSGGKPETSTERQLREFHQAWDAAPWAVAEQTLHRGTIARPPAPAYADFVERSSSGQEDLMRAFDELFTAPASRHVFALTLAAFIDVIVFLLAYASGPYFFGAPEQRWSAAGAMLDACEEQVFLRDFLRKLKPGRLGLARVDVSELTPGELQFCLLLAAKGQAAPAEQDGVSFYLLERETHQRLVESLETRNLPLRAAAQRAAAGA